MSLAEHDVQAALAALTRRNLVLERFGAGDRVPKYQQLFCNTEFGSLQLSPQQTAIVCELLVRGPQTPGELRSRAARLAEFRAPGEVEGALEELMTRPDGPYVARLAREPGRRESRYMQLFTGEAPAEAEESVPSPAVEPARATRAALDERVAALEQAVSELRAALAELRTLLERGQ
jgi:uncharacterized protein YceH (UPF0502 family)